jgi:hypothetical protein
MGYGLGAVEAGTPGALSLDEARRHVEARTARYRAAHEPAPPAERAPPSTGPGGAAR